MKSRSKSAGLNEFVAYNLDQHPVIHWTDTFQVMMKNLCTPVECDDIRTIITTNLDRAAKLNFAQVQQESHLEGL